MEKDLKSPDSIVFGPDRPVTSILDELRQRGIEYGEIVLEYTA